MRFLMLNWRDPRNPMAGGAERVSRAYLRELVRRGHQVSWFANAFPECVREEWIDGMLVVRGGGKGTSILEARKWFRTQPRFDLVIDQHHGLPWYAPWWTGTPTVAYIHEVLGPIWNVFYRWPLNIIGRWQERWTHWMYRNVPFWVPSNSTRNALQAAGVRQVSVFPNGLDSTPLATLDEKRIAPPIRLIAVSRLAANKRVEHAIEATRILLEGGLETRLTIVGGGEHEPTLRRLVADLGLGGPVTFTGPVSEEEKNVHLADAFLLLHASIREGWGLNVIEANAMGTPAVVYPVAGLVDSTLHDETGIITQRESPRDLASAVRALANDPEKYQRLRQAAWVRAKEHVWEKVLPPACDWLEQQAGTAQEG